MRAAAVQVIEDGLSLPSHVRGECVSCGMRTVYVRRHKTWVHDATLGQVFAAAASLDLDLLHSIRVLVDED